jgi:hypothetical protein
MEPRKRDSIYWVGGFRSVNVVEVVLIHHLHTSLRNMEVYLSEQTSRIEESWF